MKVFKKMNISGKPCPVCGTKDLKEVVLIPIDGTSEGNNEQAIQVHLDCINLRYSPEGKAFYQKVNIKNG